MTPDYSECLTFLNRFHPNGCQITAIPRNGGMLERLYVTPENALDGVVFIERYNKTHNIYFNVNALEGPTKQAKGTDEEVLHGTAFHCDIDARKGKEVKAELERIESLVQNLPDGVPEPSITVFTGGGFHLYWLTAEPVEDLDVTRAINTKLIAALGGDKGTHDVSRILRVPNTLNLPNEAKMKKGREVALAEVREFNDLRYMPADFDGLPDAPVEKKKSVEIDVSVNVDTKKIERFTELPAEIKGDARIIIAQGCDPDNPDRFPSRSEALHYSVNQMYRDGIPPQTIFNIITDPDWAISESVLDKGRQANAYAIKQIEKAAAENAASVIVQRPGALPEVIAQIEDLLIDNEADIYQRGSELVRPVTVGVASDDDDQLRRAAGTMVILPVKKHTLAQTAEGLGTFAKVNNKGKLYASDLDLKYCDHLLARAGDWRFRPLAGIINTPTLRRDGSVLDTPGYDTATGLVYDPKGEEFPMIPGDADFTMAQDVMLELYKPFRYFPAVSDPAKSVILSAVLTAMVPNMFDAVPMHVFDASDAGTGKTLLCDAVGITATGHPLPASAQGKTEEEDEKRLATALRDGDLVILIDNITQPIKGDFLCSAITNASVQARILGKSERVILPTRTLFMANGNNVSIHADMTRRVLVCRLDAEVERPERRTFDFCPREYCREHRPRLVTAGLTAIRAYLNAGRPMRSQVPALGSFEQWNVIRELLVWLGYADPVQTQIDVVENDETRDELAEFLNLWVENWDGQEMTAGQIIALAETSDDVLVRECVMDKCGGRDWNVRKLGRWLTKNRDRVVNGMILRRQGARSVYSVQRAKSVSSVSDRFSAPVGGRKYE